MKPNPADAFADTPQPTEAWRRMSDAERSDIVRRVVAESPSAALINVVAAREDGEVVLSFNQSVGAAERGGVLLDLEALLKQTVDASLNVWLEPLGDKNSLRNLRGIEVKS